MHRHIQTIEVPREWAIGQIGERITELQDRAAAAERQHKQGLLVWVRAIRQECNYLADCTSDELTALEPAPRLSMKPGISSCVSEIRRLERLLEVLSVSPSEIVAYTPDRYIQVGDNGVRRPGKTPKHSFWTHPGNAGYTEHKGKLPPKSEPRVLRLRGTKFRMEET